MEESSVETHPLHEAVRSGDVARVEEILQRDPSCVNEKNHEGDTALHQVYDHWDSEDDLDDCSLPMMRLLLEHGADVNAQTGLNKYTPLLISVAKSQIDGVKLLLEHNADPDIKNRDGDSPLSLVTEGTECGDDEVDDEIGIMLIQHGADVDLVGECNVSPLDNAAINNKMILVQALVEAGANVNVESKYGNPLLSACYCRNPEMIELLISRGATATKSNKNEFHALAINYHQYTIIRQCNQENVNRCVKMILDLGVDINAQDSYKQTALHHAVKIPDKQLVRALLEAGADVNLKDKNGNTPLHVLFQQADYKCPQEVIELLIKHGSNLTVRNNIGLTPFQTAVKYKNVIKYTNVLNLMLSKITGIEENTFVKKDSRLNDWFDQNQAKWLHYKLYELGVAALYGYEHVVDRLIDMGYDVDAKDVVNKYDILNLEKLKNNIRDHESDIRIVKPPLYYAVKMHHYETAKVLLEAGCKVDCTPSLDLRNMYSRDNEQDFKLACLLWKYTGDLILSKSIVNALTFYLKFNADPNKLTNAFVFCYAIELRSNKRDANLKPIEPDSPVYEKLSPILTQCNTKLDDLKNTVVVDSTSQFDILAMKMDLLVKFLNDEKNFDACDKLRETLNNKEDLETCEYLILECINLAVEKRKLLDVVKNYLNNIFKSVARTLNYENFPDEIICKILSNFNLRELKKTANSI